MLSPQAQINKVFLEMNGNSSEFKTGISKMHSNGVEKDLPFFMRQNYFPYEYDKAKYKDAQLDLNSYLIDDPSSTFFIRATGESMINAGIKPDDILVVDKTRKVKDKNIVIAAINNELTVKRIKFMKNETVLVSENKDYHDIKITPDDKFDIWGVVTAVIKTCT